MSAHVSELPSPPPWRRTTHADALAAFVRQGRRERVIAQLERQWRTLGRPAVEDAVDQGVEIAARNMRATEPDAVEAYVRRAAWRQLKDVKRRAALPAAPIASDIDFDVLDGSVLSPEEIVIARENSRLVTWLVRDAVSDLDDRTLAVLRLKHLEGLERKQVATALGLSEKQVKKAIERGHRVCSDSYHAAADGRMCERRLPALVSSALGTAGAAERLSAERHMAHCDDCCGFYRAVHASQRAALALLPAPIAGHLDSSTLSHLFEPARGPGQARERMHGRRGDRRRRRLLRRSGAARRDARQAPAARPAGAGRREVADSCRRRRSAKLVPIGAGWGQVTSRRRPRAPRRAYQTQGGRAARRVRLAAGTARERADRKPTAGGHSVAAREQQRVGRVPGLLKAPGA
jgi:RNA polymerase sigma factor (sigma-70 family)